MTKASKHPVRGIAVAAALAALALEGGSLAAQEANGVEAWQAGDYAGAVESWREAARRGDSAALFNLAQAYRLGRGVEADTQIALEYYRKAAAKGHKEAAGNYGLMLFEQGHHAQAMPLIEAASERGDPRAHYVLALSHFNADHSPRDWVRAWALITLADEAGLTRAAQAREQMTQFIPEAQRDKGLALSQQMAGQLPGRTSETASRTRHGEVRDGAAGQEPRAKRSGARVNGLAATAVPTRRPARPAPPALEAPVTQPPIPDRPANEWRLQLGAFGVEGNAERLWSRLSSDPALSGASKQTVDSGLVTLLYATGFADRSQAQQACAALKRRGQDCLVTRL